VLFLLIGLPLNLVLLGLFFWYCSMRPRSFAASLFGSAALSVLVVTLALTHYKHIVSPRRLASQPGWAEAARTPAPVLHTAPAAAAALN
jgi:hypothetical protein